MINTSMDRVAQTATLIKIVNNLCFKKMIVSKISIGSIRSFNLMRLFNFKFYLIFKDRYTILTVQLTT